MSAIEESPDGPIEVIQVLIVLHPSFGAQELCGPLEVLSNAHHQLKDPGKLSCLMFLSFQLLKLTFAPRVNVNAPVLMHHTRRIQGF